MQVIDSVAGFTKALEADRAAGRTVGLVPTMGYLHEGHASLMRRAAADCDVVAASVFVNPLQFGPGEDLASYPRDLDHDIAVASASGVRYLFAPSTEEMYPGPTLTTVRVEGVSRGLEGDSRPGHFSGVATVVAKLFALAGACRAYFGEKDYQQLVVIGRMARDLSFPVEVVGCPTVREADGLALSSRNVHLSPEERSAAPVLYRALRAGRSRPVSPVPLWSCPPWRTRCGPSPGPGSTTRPRSTPSTSRCPRPCRARCASWSRPASAPPASSTTWVLALRPDRLETAPATTAETPGHRETLMRRRMLKSKIHRATVTDANLNYVGSITLDSGLMELADIREWEQVAVLDIDNGARFETYAIAGGPGEVCLNGAAARLVQPGDKVIVITYADYEEADLASYGPRIVQVDARNRALDQAELAADARLTA